jgi:excinuclease ABC subunit B
MMQGIAAEEFATYTATAERSVLEQNIDDLIAEMERKMEAAAKALDFQSAAQYRDRMYELQKIRDNMKR